MSREYEIFAEALDLEATQRDTFLQRACAGNDALRARIDTLLRGHERAGDLLRQPLVARRPAAAVEKPGDVIGPYTLLEKIGEGGCGVVWLAEQREPVRRRVALKDIKLGMDTAEIVARFEAERRALALMNHRNIACVFDGGVMDSGRPFFVMEYVPGVPITRYCDQNRLTIEERIELVIAVCAAVHHAHGKGIIHRDLKPSNILVTECEGKPVPKVIDFGVAKAIAGRLGAQSYQTSFYALIGTPGYMSPEQAEQGGGAIDARSDLYSLGMVLYELLAGDVSINPHNFAGAGTDELRRQIRSIEPARASEWFKTFPEELQFAIAWRRGLAPEALGRVLADELDAIIMRCLARDRAGRYPTAKALGADLRRYLRRNDPARARQRRAVIVAVLGLALLVILGLVAVAWRG